MKTGTKRLMDELRQQQWHLSKRVQVADILLMLSLATGLAWWIFSVEQHALQNSEAISTHEVVMEVELRNLKARDVQLNEQINGQQAQIMELLHRIDDKLDRHLERSHNSEAR